MTKYKLITLGLLLLGSGQLWADGEKVGEKKGPSCVEMMGGLTCDAPALPLQIKLDCCPNVEAKVPVSCKRSQDYRHVVCNKDKTAQELHYQLIEPSDAPIQQLMPNVDSERRKEAIKKQIEGDKKEKKKAGRPE